MVICFVNLVVVSVFFGFLCERNSSLLSFSATMPRFNFYREVNCHNKLNLQDRVRVIKAYKKIQSYNKLAKQFKCSLYQIRSILKDKQKILKEYIESKEYITRSDELVNAQAVELLEKVVYEWFQRAQRHIETGPITNEIFLQKAAEIKQICCMKNFDIDYNWLLKFRQNYDIDDLDMTLLRIGNDNEPLSLNNNEIIEYIVDQNPMLRYLVDDVSESLSELEDSDFKSDSQNETCQRLQEPAQYSISSNDQLRVNNENTEAKSNVVELIMPPIASDEQAIWYLKPLEDYVLMKENFRAIGLIAQLEEIFNVANKK